MDGPADGPGGAIHNFSYIRGRLHTSTRKLNATENAVTRVQAVQTLGMLGTSVRADSVRGGQDGPRTEFCDCSVWGVDRWGAPTYVRDAYGQVTTIRRGDLRWPGRVTEMVAPNGFTTTATYDARGNPGSTTAWSPYGDGRNATTTYQWHPYWDRPVQVVAPEGEISLAGYDTVTGQRLWEQAGPHESRRVSYGYHPATRQVQSVTAPGGGTETYTYDGRGNLETVTSPLQVTTEMLRDSLGRVVRTSVPLGTTSIVAYRQDSVVYDRRGQVRETIATGPALNGAGQQRLHARNEYDKEGNLTQVERWSVPDPANIQTITTRWEYDLGGRQIVEIAPDSTPGNWADNPRDSTFYDAAGNPDTVRTRRGDRISMEYDAMGRMTRRIVPGVSYPEVQVDGWSFPYYSNGLFIPPDTVVMTYDFRGGLLTASNRESVIGRTYHRGGALDTDSIRVRGWSDRVWNRHVYGLRYEYDRNGRRTALVLPSQMVPRFSVDTIRYRYDAVGQLSNVQGFDFFYTPSGQLERMVRPNGIELRHWYDEDGRLTRRVERADGYPGTNRFGQATDTIHDDRLHLGLDGKVVYADLLTDSVRIEHAGLGALSRMYRQPRPWDQPPTFDRWTEEVFQADALGNVVLGKSNDVVAGERWTGYQYQPGTGRLTRTIVEGQPLDAEYDAAGNEVGTRYLRLQQTRSGALAFTSERTRHYYSADHRLHTLDKRSSAGLVEFPAASLGVFEEYRYDALGRRIALRARRDSAGSPEGSIRRFVWDGDQLLYETRYPGGDQASSHWLNADTATYYFERSCEEMKNCGAGPGEVRFPLGYSPHYGRIEYLHGGGIDAPLALTRVGYGRDTIFFDPFVIYPHANWRGAYTTGTFASGWAPPSVTVSDPVTNISQTTRVQIAWPGRDLRAYLRIGSPSPATGWMGSLVDEHRDASGLLYRRNRYYSPDAGRFTQEDPIGLAGGLNLYGYAAGDPVTYSDPYGLCPEWLTGKPCNGWIATLVGLLPGIGDGSDAVSLARGRDVMTGERITGVDVLYTVVGALFASGRFGRTAGRKAEDLFGRVIGFVGDDARAFLTEAGDLVVQSADELREIRFDMRRPHPHQSSHVHVIQYERVKNKKVEVRNDRVYPSDLPHH